MSSKGYQGQDPKDMGVFAERPRTIGGSSIFRDPNYDHDGNPIVSEEKKDWGDLVTCDEEEEYSEKDERELRTNKWDKIESPWQNWTTPREYHEVINGYPYLPAEEGGELKPTKGLKRHDALTYYSDEDNENDDNFCKITRLRTECQNTVASTEPQEEAALNIADIEFEKMCVEISMRWLRVESIKKSDRRVSFSSDVSVIEVPRLHDNKEDREQLWWTVVNRQQASIAKCRETFWKRDSLYRWTIVEDMWNRQTLLNQL